MSATDGKMERVEDIERRLAQRPQGWTTTELALEYGVDPSTIYRDLQVLILLGSDITRKGRRYVLERQRQLYQVKLTTDEVLAIYLAARLLSRHSDEHNPHVVKALEKLADALRGRSVLMASYIDEAAAAIRERRTRPAYLQAIEVLGRAWAEGRKARIKYLSYTKNELTERTFAPYLIEPSAVGYACHVIGHDDLRGEVRTLKVERIREARLTNERYTIPTTFDSRPLLASAWGIMWSEDADTEVTLRFTPQAARRVRESIWHHSQRIEDEPDGSCRYTVQVGSIVEFTPWVRQWGADVEVISPLAFRDQLIAETRALMMVYGLR